MSYHIDFNDLFKQTVIGALGLVPEVGGLISSIAGALWPDTPKDVEKPLDQLKDMVNAMMSTLIDQQHADNLRSLIDGLNEVLKDYASSTSDQERNNHMSWLLDESDMIRSQFFNDDRPWATLQYLVAFGTIRLGLLREKYLFYSAIYGTPDTNPAQHLKALQDEIEAFTKRTQDARAHAIEWRKSNIGITLPPKTQNIGVTTKYTWTVTDKYLNYSHDYFRQTHINGGPDPDEESNAHADYDGRISYCDTSYAQDLDDLLAPSISWPGFNPTVPFTPTPRAMYKYDILWKGVNTAGNKDFDDKDFAARYGPISRIIIHHGDWIDGIEVFYGGVSSGLRGHIGGSATDIILGDGEVVDAMGGSGSDYPIRCWFMTNLRRYAMGGMGPNGAKDSWYLDYFGGNPVQMGDYRIAYIGGKAGTGRVDQIRVAWLYYVN